MSMEVAGENFATLSIRNELVSRCERFQRALDIAKKSRLLSVDDRRAGLSLSGYDSVPFSPKAKSFLYQGDSTSSQFHSFIVTFEKFSNLRTPPPSARFGS
jgi:hypothetical protein